MSRLRLSDVEWNTFKIKEIFSIENCKCSKVSLLKSGGTPYVGATNKNNGTMSFVESKVSLMTKGDCLVFICDGEGSVGLSFYKIEDFIGSTTVKVGRNNNLNKYNGIFISTIADTVRGKYNFGYKRNEVNLKNETLQLPLDVNGLPNWKFMEDYIKQEQKIQAQKIIDYYEEKTMKTAFDSVSLKPYSWKLFKVQDVFTVKPVKGKTISNYKDGEIPYVTTSSLNNGVNDFVSANENTSDRNAISVDPIGGKAFFHEYGFIGRGGAGSAINLLYNTNLDRYNGKFICSTIERVSKEKASYGVQLNGTRLRNMNLFLPVDENGHPHWVYMSKFMQKIELEKLEKALTYISIYIN